MDARPSLSDATVEGASSFDRPATRMTAGTIVGRRRFVDPAAMRSKRRLGAPTQGLLRQ
jgi:hypothetical protein